MDTVSTLIRSLGGDAQVAKLLASNLTPHAVAKFRVRGIPTKHWMALSRTAGVSFERLEKISAAAKAETRARAKPKKRRVAA